MTINIDEKTGKRFRETVRKEYGSKKGYLGRAVNEALSRWVKEKEKKEISERQLSWMKKGFNLGFKGYKSRDELYDRN